MATLPLHFSVGLIVGTGMMAPRLLREWRAGAKLGPVLQAWLIISWLLGLFAIVPGLCRLLELPPALVEGGWTNIFLFCPLLDRFIHHSTLLGQFGISALMAFQYLSILAALLRARRQKTR